MSLRLENVMLYKTLFFIIYAKYYTRRYLQTTHLGRLRLVHRQGAGIKDPPHFPHRTS